MPLGLFLEPLPRGLCDGAVVELVLVLRPEHVAVLDESLRPFHGHETIDELPHHAAGLEAGDAARVRVAVDGSARCDGRRRARVHDASVVVAVVIEQACDELLKLLRVADLIGRLVERFDRLSVALFVERAARRLRGFLRGHSRGELNGADHHRR